MKYSSRNGCLFYYDRSLYSWQICEPTLLFLLGLESILTFDTSITDTITLPKLLRQSVTNKLIPLHDFFILDDIYRFLTNIDAIEDSETFIKFPCNGLKFLINELTGTGKDRTIPIIFKNDNNSSLINLSSGTDLSKSKYDLQAQLIIDIFNDAGYTRDIAKSIPCHKNLISGEYYTVDQDNVQVIIYDPSHPSLNNNDKDAIEDYNKVQSAQHKSHVTNKSIYNYIDYNSMYNYSLGVLYGCRCLGYNAEYIWRHDPRFWYSGELVNLVSSAWHTFRFFYSSQACSFSDTVNNKLWNFALNEALNVQLIPYEQELTLVSNSSDIHMITYKLPDESYIDGSYLNFEDNSWHDISDKLSTSPLTGILNISDEYIIRYIGNIPLKMYKPYSCIVNDHTTILAPSDQYNYYISTNNIGWVNFDENSWLLFHSENLPVPTFGSTPYSALLEKQHRIGYAYNTDSYSIDSFYYCDLDSNGSSRVYAVFNSLVPEDGIYTDSILFREAISQDKFNSRYIEIDDMDNVYSSYIPTLMYNINTPVYIYTYKLDSSYYFNGVDHSSPVSSTGYSLTKSILLSAYNSINNELATLEVRFNPDTNQYWSKEWEPINWISHSSYLAKDIFIVKLDALNLYHGSTKIINDTTLYYKHNTEPAIETRIIEGVPYKYYEGYDVRVKDLIYNDLPSLFYIFNTEATIDQLGFISLNSLKQTHGITTYKCKPILKDRFGNSLLDSQGNPLVWYDSVYHLYWNGLNDLNQWVINEPVLD